MAVEEGAENVNGSDLEATGSVLVEGYRFVNDLIGGNDAAKVLVNALRRAWRFKRNNVQCLRLECQKLAKDTESGKLYVCKGCKVARYCSRHCQKIDWKSRRRHKISCHSFV